MSYCRWSSDGMSCDVYVYEDVSGGFTCHVAARKVINLNEAPHSPNFFDYDTGEDGKISEADIQDFIQKNRAFHDWLDSSAIRQNIGLEYDGKSFNVDTATEMAERLVELKNMGYTVPQYAIDSLIEEGLENER